MPVRARKLLPCSAQMDATAITHAGSSARRAAPAVSARSDLLRLLEARRHFLEGRILHALEVYRSLLSVRPDDDLARSDVRKILAMFEEMATADREFAGSRAGLRAEMRRVLGLGRSTAGRSPAAAAGEPSARPRSTEGTDAGALSPAPEEEEKDDTRDEPADVGEPGDPTARAL